VLRSRFEDAVERSSGCEAELAQPGRNAIILCNTRYIERALAQFEDALRGRRNTQG
jgi:hypothetical protein